MHPDVLFRLDADRQVGSGHLSRCLALAAELKSRSIRSVFAFRRADPSAVKKTRDAGHTVVELDCVGGFSSEVAELDRLAADHPGVIVLDISHPVAFANPDDVGEMIAKLRARFQRVAVIDGLGSDALYTRMPRMNAHLLIVPYVGAEFLSPESLGVDRVLAGARYFVFARQYSGVRRREVAESVHRVLITFGGSDPKSGTLIALEALGRITGPVLDIRVVIGPSFSAGLVEAIRTGANIPPHRCVLVDALECLAEEMASCDLAISAAGLTKYELALTGTPSIQISLNDSQHRAGKAFAALGTAVSIGPQDTISVDTLTNHIRDLIFDRARRSGMATAGHKVTDGLGARRIIDILLDGENAQH